MTNHFYWNEGKGVRVVMKNAINYASLGRSIYTLILRLQNLAF